MAVHVHVENLRGWLALFGKEALASDTAAASSGLLEDMLATLSVFDVSRPMDAGLVVTSAEDSEGAVVLPIIHDREKFLTFLEKKFNLHEKKSRYALVKRARKVVPDDGSDDGDDATKIPKKVEKEIACEISENPRRAICGTDRGITELGPWLRSAPKAAKDDMSVELDFSPVRAAHARRAGQGVEGNRADGSRRSPGRGKCKKAQGRPGALDEEREQFRGAPRQGLSLRDSRCGRDRARVHGIVSPARLAMGQTHLRSGERA